MNVEAISGRLISRLGQETATAMLLLLARHRQGLGWADIVFLLVESPASAFYPTIDAVAQAMVRDGVLVTVGPDHRWRLTETGVEAAMALDTESGEMRTADRVAA